MSIRDLRNSGGDVVDRASRGEQITITRAGKPVAELRRLSREPLSADELVARRRNAQAVDSDAMRDELDAILDPSL